MTKDTSASRSGASASVRRLGATTAVLIVVANMVGAGVFTTTGFLVRDIPSPAAVLSAWLVGGLAALCGALAYGELSAALPRNGGEYQILSRVYHPAAGFAAGFVSFLVGFSAPIAASALAFGKYLSAAASGVSPVVAAVVLVIVLSALHGVHVTLGSSVQNVFAVAKAALILFFVGGGLLLGDLGRLGSVGAGPTLEAVISPSFAVGLIFISFAYSGWNGAVYLAGEVRQPARTLPVALFAGTAIVTVLYLGLNITFLASAPASDLSGVVEIGHVSAVRLFGQRAGVFLSTVIALALVSAVSAMIMAGSRVYQTMGEDYPRLAFLSRRTEKGGPLTAVALQAAAAIVMVVTATFEAILTYIGVTLSVCAGLTVAGVMVLRRREPSLERPYLTWGYPFTPAVFVFLAGWMIVHGVSVKPVISLWAAGTVLAGLGLYFVAGRRDPRPRAAVPEARDD